MNFYSFVFPQTAFLKFDRSHSGKTSSYHLRPALWEAGVTVSNKVLECLVLRFAKNRILTSEAFLMALVRLHLAHGKCFKASCMLHHSTTTIHDFTFVGKAHQKKCNKSVEFGTTKQHKKVKQLILYLFISPKQ